MRAQTNAAPLRRTSWSLGLLALACLATPANAQLIDAGGQANLMRQHAMMRNQSTGDGPDWVDREARREKNGGTVMARSQRRAGAINQADLERDMRRTIDQRRAQLLPEYERRVRSDGQASADRWLREVATEMGRRDGAQVRERYGH